MYIQNKNIGDADSCNCENMSPEEKLQIANDCLDMILQDSSMAIWKYDFKTKKIIFPKNAENRYTLGNVIENVPESFVDNGLVEANSSKDFLEMYNKLFAGEPYAEGTFGMKLLNKSDMVDEHIRYKTIFNKEGVPYGAIGMAKIVSGESNLKEKAEKENLYNKSLENNNNLQAKISESMRKRQKLLADTVAGGMVGGYMEEGFPFYFIDKALLNWLGYSTEAEYICDIEGLIENGMHPDDRNYVSQRVNRQLEKGNRYEVEYRMKKKDGTYIWVHDFGERMFTPEGREAITSVCYDISKEKEHYGLLDNLLYGLEASVALYRVEENTVLTLLHASEDVMHMMNYSDEEYREICKDDAMDFVYSLDREQVRKTIRRVIREEDVITEHFRLYNKNGGVTWATTIMSRFGHDNGKPVLRVIFMPISIQNELQMQMLESNYISVYAIDEETLELYYANNSAREMHGISKMGIAGKFCYDAFYGKNKMCDNCWRKIVKSGGNATWENNGKVYNIEVQKHTWNGRNILIVYCRDITSEFQMQKQIEEKQRALEAVMHYGQIGIWTYDLDSKSITMKYSDVEPYGYDVVHKNIPNSFIEQGVIHPHDAQVYKKCYDNILSGAEMSDCIARIYYPNVKGYLWMHVYLIRQKDTADKKRYALGFTIMVDNEIRSMREAKKSQRKMQQSWEMMESACSFAGVYTMSYDTITKTAYLGTTAQQAFGLPEVMENFPESATPYGVIIPEYRQLLKEQYESLCLGKKEVKMEFQGVLSDGITHWLRLRGRLATVQADKGRTAIVTAQIIDTEKAMEARVETARQKAQKSNNALFHFILNVSKNRVTEYRVPYSKEVVSNVDMDIASFIDNGCKRVCEEKDRLLLQRIHNREELLAKFRSGVTTEEIVIQTLSDEGVPYWAKHNISLLQDPFSKDIYLYEYVYDVSQDKIMNALLKYETNSGCEAIGFYSVKEDIFAVLDIGLKDNDSNKNIVMSFSDYMNRYAERVIIEEDREKFLKHYLNKVRLIEDGFGSEIVYRVKRNGKIEYLSGYIYCYKENGKTYCVLVRRNVTELIQNEEKKSRQLADALERAKKASQAKNDFLARMSHDMRTPMNAILGMTHLATEDTKKGLCPMKYIEQIEQSSQYLLGVINDILEMGRIESGKTNLVSDWHKEENVLLPVIRMVKPLMDKKKIQLDYEIERLNRNNIEYYIDNQKTQQLFMNILNNACKFTPEGGKISIRISNVLCDNEKGYCVDNIIIEDTGCGMSEEFLERIFKPFEQERLTGFENVPGTGLGLSIAYNIARLMGGNIAVKSELGKGSIFTVTYPYHFRETENEDSSENNFDNRVNVKLIGKRVLLAEDNEINAMIASRLLNNKGIKAERASNGLEAVEKFSKSNIGDYDLILMDIRMPIMDGLEATKNIRALEREDAKIIPIIAMSANAFEEDKSLSIQAGMNEHLSKPVEPKILYQTILKYIM